MNAAPRRREGRRRTEAGRTGRRPGAPDTRTRILEAARARFGDAGFDGATIRAIAALAGVDPALVHHYFGSKQQLFVAAMELPVDLQAEAPALLAGPRDELGERVVAYVLDLWSAPAIRPLLLGVVRSAASDPVAAGMLRRLLDEGPFAAIARAIELPDADVRATLVGTQLVGILMARYVVGVEPLASLPDDALVRAVGPTIQRYLVGDLGEGTRETRP